VTIRRKVLAWALQGAPSACIVACLSCSVLEPRPDKTRFFVLASAEELGRAPATAPEPPVEPLVIGLGPIELPEYTVRNELVRRSRATEIEPARDERWGEPLESAVMRVLARNLSQTPGSADVREHPWFGADAPGIQVRIAFARFEGVERRRACVEARWEIVDTSTRAVRVSQASHFEPELEGEGGAALSRALSSALAELSNEIATALRADPAKP
jgi:uncharacterized lipoprotein YmbA